MDIFLGGSGFSFKAALETADKTDRQHFFKVNNVTVDVKNMNIKLKQSKHKLLFALVKPLLFRVMRPILQKVLSAQIKKSINQLDQTAFEIDQEAKKMEKAAGPDNKQGGFQRYFQAAQKKLTSEKKDEPAADGEKKVNVAMTQHDSKFQNISLPGGISSKATEYKELAAKGEKWESPVFGIGSAKETTSLPKAAQVTRKPHSATAGQVRGGTDAKQPNGTLGFSKEVNAAFAGDRNADYSLNGTEPPSKAVDSSSTGLVDSPSKGLDPTPNVVDPSTHTTLGTSNPVLSGRV